MPTVVPTFTLFMPGKVRTRHEPQYGRRGFYPHHETTAGMRAWRALWQAEGCPLVKPPIVLEVYVRVMRPPSHLGKSGLLKAGRAFPFPPVFDCSNVVKLVEDALKSNAFKDDSEIVALHATKRWVLDPEEAGTSVTFTTVGAAGYGQET